MKLLYFYENIKIVRIDTKKSGIKFSKFILDLIFQTNTLSTTTDRTNEIVDFSWKPPSSLVTMEEWIQTAIEVLNENQIFFCIVINFSR